MSKLSLEHQTFIKEWAQHLPGTTIFKRQAMNLKELYLDTETFITDGPSGPDGPDGSVKGFYTDRKYICYGCNSPMKWTHSVYLFSCETCGNLFQENRHLSRDMTGQVAFVVGGRSKLGHQIVVKLLKSGATVVLSSRRPDDALELFKSYLSSDHLSRLFVYPKSLDLDIKDIESDLKLVRDYIKNEFGSLDILILNAAQTIRSREKKVEVVPNVVPNVVPKELNRYKDDKFADSTQKNSWTLELQDLCQDEMEEIMRVNTIAPCLMIKVMVPLLSKSKEPYVINVHAREGLLNVGKSRFHIHTNLGKAGLHMITKCMASDRQTHISFHGCDPGWISVDEYYETSKPWICTPLDEVYGAARILYPIFKQLKSHGKTRRHFEQLTY